LTVTLLLPTPPLPLAMARMRVDWGTSVSAAFSRADQRALVITSVRSSAVISPHSMCTVRTAGCRPMRVSMSFLIWPRNGQPPMVSFTQTLTSTAPVESGGETTTSGTMPRVTTSDPSSGSITARSSSRTSSRLGAATFEPLLVPINEFYRWRPSSVSCSRASSLQANADILQRNRYSPGGSR
jgi:hypothetical protein